MAIPQRIEVIRTGSVARVLVDGQELPFKLPRETIMVEVHPDDLPTIRLTLFAKRVDVINKFDDEKEEPRP
jgi:hypothetical protein